MTQLKDPPNDYKKKTKISLLTKIIQKKKCIAKKTNEQHFFSFIRNSCWNILIDEEKWKILNVYLKWKSIN